jgi:hypothetical protein
MRELNLLVKAGVSVALLCAGSVLFSGQQQQYPPGYAGNQTVRGATTQQGYYAPVQPQQQAQRIPGQAYTVKVVPCGEFGKPPCGTVVTIPAGATGESLFAMAKASDAAGRSWEAIIYVDEAAIKGYAPAQAALGEDYVERRGVPQDLAKARYWLGLAADQGDRASQTAVGEMYERALGGPPDQAKAVHYYELAAEQHSAHAERNLGFDYELGYGVPHDRAKAIAMLRRAGADGWADATQFADALSRTRTAQFHSEGELDALVYPPPPPGKEGDVPPGCPGLLSFPASPVGLMRKGEFCAYHHGCPVQVSGMSQMCPK